VLFTCINNISAATARTAMDSHDLASQPLERGKNTAMLTVSMQATLG